MAEQYTPEVEHTDVGLFRSVSFVSKCLSLPFPKLKVMYVNVWRFQEIPSRDVGGVVLTRFCIIING